jgi:hypothetical protein
VAAVSPDGEALIHDRGGVEGRARDLAQLGVGKLALG